MYREDSASFNGSIGNGSTLSGTSSYLEIDTSRADRVYVWIDDGSTGTQAGTYDLVLDAQKNASHFTDDWMRDYSATGVQDYTHDVRATGRKFRLDLTNQSGSSGNYRIFIESVVVDV